MRDKRQIQEEIDKLNSQLEGMNPDRFFYCNMTQLAAQGIRSRKRELEKQLEEDSNQEVGCLQSKGHHECCRALDQGESL